MSETPTDQNSNNPKNPENDSADSVSNVDALSEFEKSLEKLENIVEMMEQGSLTLEQSLNAFEEGVQLTRSCQNSLKIAEQRVSKLIDHGENFSETPFNP